jgi:two-component system, chemotaxis family, chemotaxis protein CheY
MTNYSYKAKVQEMTQSDVSSKRRMGILIADDIQETRRSVRLMLSMNPNVVVVAIAADGQQAIELAKEHNPDIVIMDVNMPKIDGLTAFKEIRQFNPMIAGIVISAVKDPEALGTAMAIGIDEYLVKPFSIEDLNGAVDRAAQLIERSRRRFQTGQLGQSGPYPASQLEQLADEYTRSKRTDDQAVSVFEKLAENPSCELRWLRTLALIYIVREEWGKLKVLAGKLEQRTKKTIP